jgi:hypothetical protein
VKRAETCLPAAEWLAAEVRATGCVKPDRPTFATGETNGLDWESTSRARSDLPCWATAFELVPGILAGL